MKLDISQMKHALIIGANGSIGLATVKALLNRNENIVVHATHRSSHNLEHLHTLEAEHPGRLVLCTLEATDESSWNLLVEKIKERTKNLDLVLNTIGFLHDENQGPEKSLREINFDHLRKTFELNAFVSPMLAKHTKKMLSRKTPSAFVALSAKVGSIDDNRLGGWYGYRASKAALNMFLKTISIEFAASQLKCKVLAVHPGTTHSELSKPFSGRVKHRIWSPDETAEHLLEVIEESPREPGEIFHNWDGELLPW